MTGMNFDPSKNMFASAAGAANEVFKILKKEEKKGKSKILKAMQDFHLAHEEVKKELAKALSEDTGNEVKPDSSIVENAVFSLSLNKLFENRDGQEMLAADLKQGLQQCDSESPQAKEVIANKLSQGSRGRVPSGDKLVQQDIDYIALKTVEDKDLLY